jgi:hypothetical protein
MGGTVQEIGEKANLSEEEKGEGNNEYPESLQESFTTGRHMVITQDHPLKNREGKNPFCRHS